MNITERADLFCSTIMNSIRFLFLDLCLMAALVSLENATGPYIQPSVSVLM